MDPIQKLISLVKPYYKSPDPAHDWAHIGRVSRTAQELAAGLPINENCVVAAVYCHDLINLPKDHPERKKASTLSAEEARPLLKEAGFSEDEIALISQAVIEHSFSKGLKPSSVEAQILQDADRLDALGAIGILRCAAVNTQMKSLFYDPFDPLAEERELDDSKYMLDHYYVKLFKLPELMNTAKGKELAQTRVEFMKRFIKQLLSER